MKNRYLRFCTCICLCLLMQAMSASAAEAKPDYIIPEAVLSNSEEKEEIEALAPEIVDYANLFEEENVHASEADIDFNGAYCVYVDADIFASLPMTTQKLEVFMQSVPKVWTVPVRTDGKTVIVQISKAPELNEVDLTNITPEEQQEIEARADKWCVAASTCYDGYIDYEKQIQDALEVQGKGTEDTECVLFGGVPGIQSVLAVILEGDSATGIISMQRDINVEGDPKARNGDKEITLEQNVLYPVESYVQGIETLRNANEVMPESTGGAAGAVTEDNSYSAT